jgi:hypothetical protein
MLEEINDTFLFYHYVVPLLVQLQANKQAVGIYVLCRLTCATLSLFPEGVCKVSSFNSSGFVVSEGYYIIRPTQYVTVIV